MAAVQDFISILSPFMAEISADVLIAFFGIFMLVIVFLVKFIGYFRTVSDIASFAYPNAFVTATGNPFLRDDYLNRLGAARNIPEILEELRHGGLEITVGGDASLDEVERSIEMLYLLECDLVAGMAPDSVKPFFSTLCMIEEAEMVKRAIRAHHAGISKQETAQRLSPVGAITAELAGRMADAHSVDDLVYLLSVTAYGLPLAGALHEYHDVHSPLVFDLALDAFVLKQLSASLLFIDATQMPPLAESMEAFTDITNLKILLRAKRDGLEAEAIERHLLLPGGIISTAELKRMAESGSIPEMIGFMAESKLKDLLDGQIADHTRTESLGGFEHVLDEYLLERADTVGLVYRFGPGPLIEFLIARKFEIRNVRIFMQAIAANIPTDRMEHRIIRQAVSA
jgi:V/A-type H+-transporting ATPase subunit C